MLDSCGDKGIKQEFRNARTPQQKGGCRENEKEPFIELLGILLADSHYLPLFGQKQSILLAKDQLMVVTSTSLTEATRKAAVSEKIATKKTHSPKQPSSTPISKSADDIMTFLEKSWMHLALKH
ncbi:hypothetical protein Tco_1457776 [Tanacetum coccineum]